MLQFTSSLKKEIDTKIEQIECSEISMMTKSLEASHILTEAFKQLKVFVLSYNFKDEEEEIFFFKDISSEIYIFALTNLHFMKPIYEDSQLVVNLINDEEEAFCSLYAKYKPKIYRFIFSFLKSEDIAEDICQDVFILIWKNRKFLDPGASLQSYLYTISRNRVLNYIRDNSRKHFLDDLILSEAIDSGDDTFEKVSASELEQILQQAVDSLTGRQKEIFYLSRNEGLSHQEIALKLGISASTVNEHITNVLKFIQKQLNKHYSVYTTFIILLQLNS